MARRDAVATLSLVRRGAFLVVGLVGLVLSIGRLGTPAQDVEQSGWLYQHYGSQGTTYGMIALTALFSLLAAIMTWQAWVWRRNNR